MSNETRRILLVEDEKAIRDAVTAYLERENYWVTAVGDGQDALEEFQKHHFDLVILDLMLPRVPGERVCRVIRDTSDVPIIMLTAKGEVEDRIIGLELGADDYLVKPFQSEELLLRLNAHLRRRERDRERQREGRDHRSEAFSVGDLEIRFGKYEVRLRGEVVALSSREIELIELLASDPGAVFTRDQILETLWGSKEAADPNSITVMVRKIREKIEDDPSKPRYLVTVWRVGYKLAESL